MLLQVKGLPVARKKQGRDVDGIILLDKPQGESSNASLQKVKRLLKAAKAGHTGSLDPLATGVLPLCFGEATKVSQFLLDSDKAYQTTILLGTKTDSGDSQGSIISHQDSVQVGADQLAQALEQFRGEIEQVPSMYSALKHEGVPLYRLARQGKTVERKRRRVHIHSLELQAFDGRQLQLDISCSKGTYIRSIADDLGDVLGCGAHVTALRRTRAGPFDISRCVEFGALQASVAEHGLQAADRYLIPADEAISHLPLVRLSEDTAHFILQGQPVLVSHLPLSGLVRLYRGEQFIGVGTILDDGRVAPQRLIRSN